MKKYGFVLLLGASVLSISPVCAQQQGSNNRQANRGNPAVVVPASLVAALNANPRGGEGLSAAVTDTMLNNPDGVAIIIALDRQARTPEQKAAIAVGILRALQIIGRTDPVRARALFEEFRRDPILFAELLALQTVEIVEAGPRGTGGIVFYPGGGGFSSGGGSPGRPPCVNVSCN